MKGWPLKLSNPLDHKQILARPYLQNGALGSSGLKKGLHIIDPRTANPADNKLAAWSSAPDAATADALSTSFMIMSREKIDEYCSSHPNTSAIVLLQGQHRQIQKKDVIHFGNWEKSELLL